MIYTRKMRARTAKKNLKHIKIMTQKEKKISIVFIFSCIVIPIRINAQLPCAFLGSSLKTIAIEDTIIYNKSSYCSPNLKIETCDSNGNIGLDNDGRFYQLKYHNIQFIFDTLNTLNFVKDYGKCFTNLKLTQKKLYYKSIKILGKYYFYSKYFYWELMLSNDCSSMVFLSYIGLKNINITPRMGYNFYGWNFTDD
jgi:hypothetical protein